MAWAEGSTFSLGCSGLLLTLREMIPHPCKHPSDSYVRTPYLDSHGDLVSRLIIGIIGIIIWVIGLFNILTKSP